MVKEIVKAFNDKQLVLGLFLDLSKAFDTIDHTILLAKLYHYGIKQFISGIVVILPIEPNNLQSLANSLKRI